MTATDTEKHTLTLNSKPGSGGSMHVPQEALDALGGDGASVVLVVRDDDTVVIAPLARVLLPEK